VVLDTTSAYAELGGQVGDSALLEAGADLWRVSQTTKSGDIWLHFLEGEEAPAVGQELTLAVDTPRRRAIERHHSVTHLLHWALHEVVSPEATQKGSFVGPEKLTFDFANAPLSPGQVRDIEKLVNERIVENGLVSWTSVPHQEIKQRKDILQFFGDKYGDIVRVVQIGGAAHSLDGYSMELCGGTHVRATGEIGLFRILSEGAVAAGVRRIEAIAGLRAYDTALADAERLKALALKMGTPLVDLERRLEALLQQQHDLEKALAAAAQREAAHKAGELLAHVETLGSVSCLVASVSVPSGDALQSLVDALKGRFQGVLFLAAAHDDTVSLAAAVDTSLISRFNAGKLIQLAAPLVEGKGGGRPDFARGAGKAVSKIPAALAAIKELLSKS
jgi:alanyl-tRNA synthetase